MMASTLSKSTSFHVTSTHARYLETQPHHVFLENLLQNTIDAIDSRRSEMDNKHLKRETDSQLTESAAGSK